MREHLEKVIRSAGKLALAWFLRRQELQIHFKSAKDIVSEADIAVEQWIRQEMLSQYPDFGFYGEESQEVKSSAGRWIVDPIDGTTSFTRGQYHWCISIGVEIGTEMVLGAVYAPALDVLYLAERGKGAFCNGKPISVSATSTVEQAVMATGFACLRSGLEENNLPRFNRIAQQISATRILGSAALDCCLVADGRLDAFWEQHLNLWDVAAGAFIAQEAGATVTDFQGTPQVKPQETLISNGHLHEFLLKNI
ncbi:inositol monophosphatase family protein [Deltaproteobacteria bacterium TL4]